MDRQSDGQTVEILPQVSQEEPLFQISMKSDYIWKVADHKWALSDGQTDRQINRYAWQNQRVGDNKHNKGFWNLKKMLNVPFKPDNNNNP